MAALCAAAATTPASADPNNAEIYYVSTTGSDTPPTDPSLAGLHGSESFPFRTVLKGIQTVDGSADGVGNDTIIVKPGSYVAGGWIEKPNVTLRGDGSGDVILDGAGSSYSRGVAVNITRNVTLENLKIRNCTAYGIFAANVTGLTVRNCEVAFNASSGLLTGRVSGVLVENCRAFNNGSHGIYLSESGDRAQIRNNRMYGNQRAGLQINANQGGKVATDPRNDGLSWDCLVEGNVIFNNNVVGGSAINLMGVRNSVFVNNLLYANNDGGGIALFDDGAGAAYACKNNLIIHNTIAFDSGKGRYCIQAVPGSTDNEIYNNTLVSGRGPVIESQEPVVSNFNSMTGPTIALYKGVSYATLPAWRSVAFPKVGADGQPYSYSPDQSSSSANPLLTFSYRLPVASPARGLGSQTAALYPRRTGYAGEPNWLELLPALSDRALADKDGAARPSNPDAGCTQEVAGVEPPAPVGGDPIIFGDVLAPGWAGSASNATYSLTAVDPVVDGFRAIGITVTGRNGYTQLSGPGMSLAGKTHLVFSAHGGSTGGQELKVQLLVNGALQTASYTALPQKNGWVEYSIPLASLTAAQGNLTGVRFSARGRQGQAFVDSLRLVTQ